MRVLARIEDTSSIEDHARLIQEQVEKSIQDGQTRRLASAIVSGTYDWVRDPRTGVVVPAIEYHKRYYRAWYDGSPPPPCPSRDYTCEVTAVWNFLVLNVRYTGDQDGYDTYSDLRTTLESGAGDCFPERTLMLTPGGFTPVAQLQVGDVVHDGERWVPVLRTWDRGPKTIIRADLNSGSSLRLSETHKVLRVPRTRRGTNAQAPGEYESAEEIPMSELRVRDDLLQPRSFMAGGDEEWDPDDAFLAGAYLAEGCRSSTCRDTNYSRLSLAGVANRKGIRERAMRIFDARGVPYRERERELVLRATDWPQSELFGRTALDKHLPHFNFGPQTVAAMVAALEQGDGGYSQSGNMVFSTVSKELALAYRVLKRMEGFSTSMTTVVEHGGFGSNPIHRLTVRQSHRRRPWATIKALTVEDEPSHCYDIMTESGRVYLPEADVIVRQCDDYTIAFCALLRSIGYPCYAKIISLDGQHWAHVYPLVEHPTQGLIALDATEDGKKPGWEYRKPAADVVFDMGGPA